ncbi:hypothetical protein LIER_22512 [Lithospermum erythrorhizon]|uniref:Uncharacterized protein n=1 Tax=Lithospermum erythrorhizon TaxID=34254 RepID=A0AAV3QVR4_LITER
MGKEPVEDNRGQNPEPKRRSALDSIRAPNMAYSQAEFPRGIAFSHLQGDLRLRKEVKEGKIEYLTPLETSAGNVFLEIVDKRLLLRSPRQKAPQTKRNMNPYLKLGMSRTHVRPVATLLVGFTSDAKAWTSIKAQALADFMVDCTYEPKGATPKLINLVEATKERVLYVDGQELPVARGAEILFWSPKDFSDFVTWSMSPGKESRRRQTIPVGDGRVWDPPGFQHGRMGGRESLLDERGNG